MITETDLMLQFARETGIKLEKFSTTNDSSRFQNKQYSKWMEEKLLDKVNEEKQIENLFTNGE